MDYSEYTLGELRTIAGLSEADISAIFEISASTWHQWQRHGTSGRNRYLTEILAGRLPYKDWAGWRIQSGWLIDPLESLYMTPADLYRIHWQLAELRLLRRQQRTDEPLPDDPKIIAFPSHRTG